MYFLLFFLLFSLLLYVLFRHEKTRKHAEIYTNMYVYRTGYLQFRIIPGIHWGDQVWDTMLYERPLASLKLCPEFLNFVQKIIGILLPKLFWPTVRKNCSSDWEKTFEIRGWRPRICNIFEITRKIYSNTERSKQFLVTESFF